MTYNKTKETLIFKRKSLFFSKRLFSLCKRDDKILNPSRSFISIILILSVKVECSLLVN